jgi:hypothetical protein
VALQLLEFSNVSVLVLSYKESPVHLPTQTSIET